MTLVLGMVQSSYHVEDPQSGDVCCFPGNLHLGSARLAGPVEAVVRCASCCCRQVASVVSNSVRPHRRQPTRLPCPWDSPGKNTGVGCHFLLQCMNVKSESEVAQSYPTLRDLMDCSLPGSSVHGIFQVLGHFKM